MKLIDWGNWSAVTNVARADGKFFSNYDTLYECPTCFAVVRDRRAHAGWHVDNE